MIAKQASFLTSPLGNKLLQIAGEYHSIPQRLRILRRETCSDRAALVSHQITLRHRAQKKFSRAQQMLFEAEALEQASAEIVAEYIAKRFGDFANVVDLTCGIGGDSLALAGHSQLIANDRSLAKTILCRHNVSVYERHCQSIVADATRWFPPGESYFIDPSRRVSGQRVSSLEQSTPGLDTIIKLLHHCPQIAIKVSPALDYERLPFDCEVEIIAVGSECREIILWCGQLATTARRATQLLPKPISLIGDPQTTVPVTPPQTFLYEVDRAVLRAHLVATLAQQHQLSLLDSRLSYLTADQLCASPWLKPYRIMTVMPFAEKKVRKELQRRGIGKVEVKSRGFVGNSDIWQKKFVNKGTQFATLFLTRIAGKPVAILAVAC